MKNFIIDNKCGILKKEMNSVDLIKHFLDSALKNKKEISLYITADFRFFDSFKDILPALKKLFDEDLLKKFYIIISSDSSINPKDFLFKLKTDAISLNSNDFFLIKLLNNSGVLRFRINYKNKIGILMYLIKYNAKSYSYVGSASFSPRDNFNNTIDLIAPVSSTLKNSSIYYRFFKRIWTLSESKVNNTRIVNHLKHFSEAEFINLNPRNFIAVMLKSISKEYLVKNISTDFSKMAEFKNMGYYSCIEKMQKYGSVIFANSIGLSELYISSMIVKFYFEKNLKSLIICSSDNERLWEQNFTKTGLKKSFATFINRTDLQRDKFSTDNYDKFDLIIIDNAEYFSISKERNNRKKHLDNILELNPDAHIMMISKNIINDSLDDLILIYKMFSRGKFSNIFKEENIHIEIENLLNNINEEKINNDTIESIKKILNTFMVKIEWTNIDSSIDPLQQDLNKPSITTVKYAYDHEISMKIYEKLIPTIEEFKFEYSKLKFDAYHEDRNLTNWYKWRLCRTIESSLIAFMETLKNLREKTKVTLDLITKSSDLDAAKDFFNTDQIENIRKSFSNADSELKKSIIDNLDSDITVIDNFFVSASNVRYLENRDEKVTGLLKILNTESKPTIIFSESDETILYLKRRLMEYGNLKSAVIPGETTTIDGDDILNKETINIEEVCTQFESGEYNILISNEMIAEEIKLPRAKVIVNFDLPINPSSLSKRNRIASSPQSAGKTKIYNFQSDKRVDKEVNLFEKLNIPLHELIAYYGIDFILWCIDEGYVSEISEKSLNDFYLLTKDYKDFFAKKNTDEIKSKFSPSLSEDDMTLREFIKYLNISEETLKLAVSNFKRPILTSLKSAEDNYYIIYRTSSGIKTMGKLFFSDIRIEDNLSANEFKDIRNSIEKKVSEKNEGELEYIIGIIKYS